MKINYSLWHYLHRRVEIDGRKVRLGPSENDLFFMLYVNMGRSVPLDNLVEVLWGEQEDGGPLETRHGVRQRLYRLGKKTGLRFQSRVGFGVRMFEPIAGAAE